MADSPSPEFMSHLSYTAGYYQSIREDSAASARESVPLIMKLFAPRSVVDVGCGPGTWASEYKRSGASVLGIDGYDVRTDQLLIEPREFERRELTRPLRLERGFDLVNCLEVAEHLPATRAASFVEDLCRLGDVVLFSAAVPGQGGTHHINEQWPSYWIAFFQGNGFQALDCIRPQLWKNEKVAWWYAQNMFVFIRQDRVAGFPAAVEAGSRGGPVDLVHPRAYARATVPREMSPRMIKEVLRALPYFPGKIAAHLRKR
ncbi:MAG: class I SAM-dependent methyltransferase [Verrucomicrobia bacterium]|nr:MAG: class I SAM-dependent methyltransferase [Verrucomicrobiota bacterium]